MSKNKKKKKYELLKSDKIYIGEHALYRIRALKDFGGVTAGDLGGYIEKEKNLSHEGKCWVCCSARVYGNARVSGNAMIHGNANVYGHATVSDNARIAEDSNIYGHARVLDNAIVHGQANIFGYATLQGYAYVYGTAYVEGNASINCRICEDAEISSEYDYCAMQSVGSRNDNTTFFKCTGGVIKVACGCFKGTLKEFKKKVFKTHGFNKYAREYYHAIKIAKIKLGGK